MRYQNRLTSRNRKQFVALYRELDSNDRTLRFAHAVSQEYAVQYAEKLSLKDNIVIGEFSDNGELVAAIELVDLGGYKNSVEIGLVVSPRYRRQGIGSELFKRAMRMITILGYRHVHSLCLTQNSPMMHLVKKNGFEVESSYGESIAIKTDVPSIYSLATLGNKNFENMLVLLHDHSITDFRNFWRIFLT